MPKSTDFNESDLNSAVQEDSIDVSSSSTQNQTQYTQQTAASDGKNSFIYDSSSTTVHILY